MAITKTPIELSSTPGIVDNSNATAITIDSGENVGIGVSNPSDYYAENLVVAAPAEGGITIKSAATDHAYLMFADGTTGSQAYRGYLGHNHSTDSTSLVSFGKVGLSSVNETTFTTNSTERMRIDSSGDVVVGGTSSGANDAVSLSSSGYIQAIVNGDTVGYFNRRTNDGEILRFQKNGTTVGSVGTRTGSLYIGTGDAGIGFNHHGGGDLDSVMPYSVTTGAFLNGAVDIGGSANKFKNLHLSGTLNGISTTKSASGNRWGVLPEVESNGVMEVGRYLDFHSTDGDTSDYGARLDFNGTDIVSTNAFQMSSGIYLGGTGAANKLDDYEEGTWTLGMSTSNNNATLSLANTTGSYTKVGRKVTCTIYTGVINISAIGTGAVKLTGLPFACSGGNKSYACPTFGHTNCFAYGAQGYVAIGQTFIVVTRTSSVEQNAFVQSATKYMMFTITYFTDS